MAFSGFVVTFDFSKQRIEYPDLSWLIDIVEQHWVFWVFVACAISAFCVNLFLAVTSPSRLSLQSALNKQKAEIEAITDHVVFCVDGFIWEQAKRAGVSVTGASRISLYVHEPAESRFFCLVRKSYNTKLEKKGRTFFADDEGCLAKAWEQDWHFDNGFPDDDKANAEYQKSEYGISKGTFSQLTMPSKLIAVKKVVDRNDRPIALIVVESTKSNEFDENDLQCALTIAATDCAHLLTVWKDHLPTPSAAQDEGL
ncbi:hypothetical protein [Cochlodiniinecator piscidefendens]|uniref:hypothetical protein n=1 Tax=Cochlodiniinecator piscidefendens TaxID=2715756 RepID=UPI00140A0FB5|nr:hypothetical protein [Cochlodiniinecator piscidefendens]